MSKLTNLLITLVLISTGVISCTNHGFVKKKDFINQQHVNTINQNGNYRQVLPQPEKDNMTRQAVPADISTKKKPSLTTSTKNNHSANKAIDKKHVYNLPGLEQDQIKLNQVGLAHLALGIAFAERNMIDQAISEFQSAIEENPRHLESHIRLGTAYGIKGMANEAKSEFKKAMNIDLNEAVAKIVFDALPVAANAKKQKNLLKAHINLGNAYKKEAKLKKAQLVFEKALALKPEHPIAIKLLSEIYFNLGTSHLESQAYDDAIVEFNKVLDINPDFPHIKDALEKAHYSLGIIYAKNKNLDKAIIEFNKTMELNHNYAMLEKSNLNIISKDKKAISDKRIHSGKSHSDGNVHDGANNDVIKESFHAEEQEGESLQNQIPDQFDVAEEMILTKKGNEKGVEYDQNQEENQHSVHHSQGNSKNKLVKSLKNLPGIRKLQKTNDTKPEKARLIKEPTKENKNEKQIQENIAYEQTIVKQATGESLSNNQLNIGVAKSRSNSDYSVYTYNITRNYKTKIGINEAIKKYEDATINSPYDSNAFLNLAHAYYCKAMYLDDAIAIREDVPQGNQNFSVKRFYLNDDADNEKNRESDLSELTNTFGDNIAFRNRSGNMYEEMFHEAIIEYKNALRINPNSSNALYGLAFSFSLKGSSSGIALKSKSNPKGILFSY
jgi:tetratricopeptide (TPR) repeat protein